MGKSRSIVNTVVAIPALLTILVLVATSLASANPMDGKNPSECADRLRKGGKLKIQFPELTFSGDSQTPAIEQLVREALVRVDRLLGPYFVSTDRVGVRFVSIARGDAFTDNDSINVPVINGVPDLVAAQHEYTHLFVERMLRAMIPAVVWETAGSSLQSSDVYQKLFPLTDFAERWNYARGRKSDDIAYMTRGYHELLADLTPVLISSDLNAMAKALPVNLAGVRTFLPENTSAAPDEDWEPYGMFAPSRKFVGKLILAHPEYKAREGEFEYLIFSAARSEIEARLKDPNLFYICPAEVNRRFQARLNQVNFKFSN